jgi:hypothetical protein
LTVSEVGSLLASTLAAMTAAGWHTFGNHLYAPPDSPLARAGTAGPLRLPPWGPQPAEHRLWLGLGIGAFGYRYPAYYRNTASVADYRAALHRRQLPDKMVYRVPAEAARDLDVAQSLLCHHEVGHNAAPEFCEQLLRDALVAMTKDSYKLTTSGIHQLSTIVHRLRQQAASGDDHGTTQNRARRDR